MKKSKIENSLVLFFFLPERHFILPEGACGEGISKGNIIFVRRDADSFSYTAKAVIPL